MPNSSKKLALKKVSNDSESSGGMFKPLVITIIAIFTILGGVMTLNSGNVTKGEFAEYKEGKTRSELLLDQRLTRFEEKLDKALERLPKD